MFRSRVRQSRRQRAGSGRSDEWWNMVIHGVVSGRQAGKTTLEKITHVTCVERPRELIPLWQAEQSGKKWRKGHGFYTAADETIRYRCGGRPGAPEAGSCAHAGHTQGRRETPRERENREKHRGNESQPEP